MIRFLWTKVIEPWLEEIADERAQPDGHGWAIGVVAWGILVGVLVLVMFGLLAAGAWALLTQAPQALIIILIVVVVLTSIGWFIWTLAGDGSNDRDRSR